MSEPSQPVIQLWECAYGHVKPVRAIDLGDGNIKVVGSVLIKQERAGYNESFHETQEEAVTRLLSNLERDLDRAIKDVVNGRRRIVTAKLKYHRV